MLFLNMHFSEDCYVKNLITFHTTVKVVPTRVRSLKIKKRIPTVYARNTITELLTARTF